MLEKFAATYISSQKPLNVMPYNTNHKEQYKNTHSQSPSIDILKSQVADLKLILSVPLEQFWSYALLDKSLAIFLDTYLWLCPRKHTKLDDQVELEIVLSKRIFAFYWRLLFDNSEKFKFFESIRGDILQKYKIFTIPRILDLCSIFGTDNKKILNILLQSVFSNIPSLHQDLIYFVPKLITNLNEILKNPKNTSEYLSDLSLTLLSLVKIFPYASLAFDDLEFLVQVALCYENVVFTLPNNINIKNSLLELLDFVLKESYLKTMVASPKDVLKITRDNYFDQQVSDTQLKALNTISGFMSRKNTDQSLVKLITTLSSATKSLFGESEVSSRFLFDYDQKFGLESWLFNWQSSGIKLCNDDKCISNLLTLLEEMETKFASAEEKAKLQKLKDLSILFPECESQFLLELYHYYEGNVEKVTNAMLEKSFPQKFIQSMEKMPNLGINATSPMTGDVSPTTWHNVNFFGSGGKKKQQVGLDVIDEELRMKILDTVSYDDEYDDSYDQYLTVQEKESIMMEEAPGNPNRQVKKPDDKVVGVKVLNKEIKTEKKVDGQEKKQGEGKTKDAKEKKPNKLQTKESKPKEVESLKDRRDKEQNKAKVGNHDRKKLRDKKTKLLVNTTHPQ